MSPAAVPPSPRGILLLDPSGTAHAANAIAGLARAAHARGLAVAVHAPAPPDDVPVQFVAAETATMLVDRRLRRRHRDALVAALRAAPAGWLVCDLGLGRTLQGRGPRIPDGPALVLVGHETSALDPDRVGRRAARGNARVLAALGRRPNTAFVVHTPETRARLAAAVPADRVRAAGWPVASAASLDGPVPAAPERPVTLLFAGAVRPQKGLDLLLEAIRKVDGFDRLLVAGRVPDAMRARLDLSDPRLEVWDRWLDEPEYRAALRAASVVVLPYRSRYVEHGIASSIMSEAMAEGRPLVVSSALGRLLPAGYPGAVVTADDSPDALAAALTDALARRAELAAGAATVGRAHVRAHHTYEAYLDALVDATAPAAPAGPREGHR